MLSAIITKLLLILEKLWMLSFLLARHLDAPDILINSSASIEGSHSDSCFRAKVKGFESSRREYLELIMASVLPPRALGC